MRGQSYEGTKPAGSGDDTGSGPGERRVALVIGNGAYRNTRPLANPANDAAAIAAALERHHFTVIGGPRDGLNLTYAGLWERIRNFARALRNADTALFFYAGHGMQVAGQNYLVPVDAACTHEQDVHDDLIDVTEVLKRMERPDRTSLVFLDACRDNPLAQNLARAMGFASTKDAGVALGLAEQKTSEGTLIAFATQPGNIAYDGEGQNSYFTQAFLERIEAAPEQDVLLLMRDVGIRVRSLTKEKERGPQVPWLHTSLLGSFTFATTAVAPEREPSSPVSGTAPTPGGFAERDWERFQIAETNDLEVIEAYIAQYERSEPLWAVRARQRLAEVQKQLKAREEEERQAAEERERKETQRGRQEEDEAERNRQEQEKRESHEAARNKAKEQDRIGQPQEEQALIEQERKAQEARERQEVARKNAEDQKANIERARKAEKQREELYSEHNNSQQTKKEQIRDALADAREKRQAKIAKSAQKENINKPESDVKITNSQRYSPRESGGVITKTIGGTQEKTGSSGRYTGDGSVQGNGQSNANLATSLRHEPSNTRLVDWIAGLIGVLVIGFIVYIAYFDEPNQVNTDDIAGFEDNVDIDKSQAPSEGGDKPPQSEIETDDIPKTERHSEHQDWAVYVHGSEDANQVCFAASEAKESMPSDTGRGDAYVYLTTWAGDGIKNEISIKSGYEFQEGSEPKVQIADKEFLLFTRGDSAFLRDPIDELNLVETMKAQSSMNFLGTSESGKEIVHTYSLLGLTASLKDVNEICR